MVGVGGGVMGPFTSSHGMKDAFGPRDMDGTWTRVLKATLGTFNVSKVAFRTVWILGRWTSRNPHGPE
ncbi:hypothetical protein HDA45_005740 [Amycolatopsis umgeniensis]|uniref:Uncharacterized protein n=1 Tax=Amycolatopsis umgeniensis TaxID=336628 RepID=A0A841B9U1_9PSEU|nr:hypothetical protein [Amycolatopsis umgeniensis]